MLSDWLAQEVTTDIHILRLTFIIITARSSLSLQLSWSQTLYQVGDFFDRHILKDSSHARFLRQFEPVRFLWRFEVQFLQRFEVRFQPAPDFYGDGKSRLSTTRDFVNSRCRDIAGVMNMFKLNYDLAAIFCRREIATQNRLKSLEYYRWVSLALQLSFTLHTLFVLYPMNTLMRDVSG